MAEIDDNVAVEEERRHKPEEEVRHRKKGLYKALRRQMEFYFGDANLTKDKFLIDLIERDKNVDLSVFLRFNKIRTLTSSIEDIANALRDSELLSVTDDGIKVYRTTPIQIKENEEECTIYVEQLPPDADHEWLQRVFSSYGEVVYVSIPKYRQSNKIKGFAFVEFDTPEGAQKTLEAFGAVGCRLPAQMPPDNLCSITAFVEPPEEDTNGEQTAMASENIEKSDSDQPTNQKKRKLDNPDSSIDSETGTDVSLNKKKKRKKIKGNECEEISVEPEKHVVPSKAASDNAGSTITTKKRKSRDSNSQMLNVDVENETNQVTLTPEVADESENPATEEAYSKKQKREEIVEGANGDECGMDSYGVADENKDESAVEETRKKKKKARNKKGKKKVKQGNNPSKLGLKILSKHEWKRLRNKYLDLQRTEMKAAKQHLARARWSSQTPRAHSEDGENAASQRHEESQQQTGASSDQSRTVFTPGVIVHVTFDEPVSDVVKFKNNVRTYSDVLYVDATEGTNEAYMRFSTPSSAVHFVQKKPFGNMEILSGDEETNYWNKIKQDREKKFSQKIKVNQRGRDKILKRVERELGKHIRFDE